MAHIVMPTTASRQGGAFEDLLLSHFQRTGRYVVREWSTYLHGSSGKWWQCDGIVEDDQHRYLIEAKFFRDRPAGVGDIDPTRRESAALDNGCTAIQYISLNGFEAKMREWKHSSKLKVQFSTWADLRDEVLDGLTDHASVLLHEFALTDRSAAATQSQSVLYFDTVSAAPILKQFPEFVALPDSLELWLRRMPKLPLHLSQLSIGTFYFDEGTGDVRLVAQCPSDLSLGEAWKIEDAFSGYAARTYQAVRATAMSLASLGNGLIREVQAKLGEAGYRTGPDGVRNSLDFLVQLGLAQKELAGRTMRYTLTNLGRACVAAGPCDELFVEILKAWPPYCALSRPITLHKVAPKADDLIAYFRSQYAPYTPYAKSLYNPNKTEGLLRLYKMLGG